jgi:single-stranded DNA-binding protein
MDSFSEVVIRGRLGANKKGEAFTEYRTPDLKYYWRFSVGVEKKKYLKESDTTVVEMDWISCTCWDKRVVEHGYLDRGQVVQVTGRLTTYGEKVEGSELSKTRLAVVAERVQPVVDAKNSNWEPISSGSAR